MLASPGVLARVSCRVVDLIKVVRDTGQGDAETEVNQPPPPSDPQVPDLAAAQTAGLVEQQRLLEEEVRQLAAVLQDKERVCRRQDGEGGVEPLCDRRRLRMGGDASVCPKGSCMPTHPPHWDVGSQLHVDPPLSTHRADSEKLAPLFCTRCAERWAKAWH